MKFFDLRHATAQSRCVNGLLCTQNLQVPKSGCILHPGQSSLAACPFQCHRKRILLVSLSCSVLVAASFSRGKLCSWYFPLKPVACGRRCAAKGDPSAPCNGKRKLQSTAASVWMVPEHMVLRTLLFLKQGEASET